ncbi:MAG: HD domain-containing protein [Rhodanobacteraceae bacterium]|nr:HD domain-containing protein [Rhodanobacteraceae bacterium]
MTVLTHRFTEAIDYARIAHAAQFRKGSGIPYLYHLLGVASLVLEYGGDEDQAIAGLLHDVLEDCGEEHAATIRTQFGDAVGDIVKACTDGTVEGKAKAERGGTAREHWRERKLKYLDHFRHESSEALLVSGCDKLHNARAILGDLQDPAVDVAVFERFTAKRDGTLRYYQSLTEILTERQAPMARAFDATVARIHEKAGATERRGLA